MWPWRKKEYYRGPRRVTDKYFNEYYTPINSKPKPFMFINIHQPTRVHMDLDNRTKKEHDDLFDAALYSMKVYMGKEKEKKMDNIELKNVKLKKDECGYYLRLKYIQENDQGVYEIIIPKLRLPINTKDVIIKHETCINPEVNANIGFGFFPLENGVTEHSDGKEVVFTVKELKKKVHKMTVADIEKKLGYRIEIVSEESEG